MVIGIQQGDRVEGLGAPGAPVGQVVSVQGVPGGTAQPSTVTGTVTADTELPAATALVDNGPNLTTPSVGAAILGWDGANVQRLRALGDDADGVLQGTLGRLVVDARLYGVDGNGANTWSRIRGTARAGLKVYMGQGSGDSLVQTGKSGANASLTVTLPALGTGHFQAIDYIYIVRTCTTAVASTTSLDYTTTNLNGLAWTIGNALAVGATQIDVQAVFVQPLIAAVTNTAVTIVIPALGATALSRVTVVYRDLVNP